MFASPDEYAKVAALPQEVAAQLLARLQPIYFEPKIILDVGCKIGTLTHSLKKLFPHAKVYGTDPSPAMIAYAKAHANLDITWICANLNESPVEVRSVDLITANLCLPWVEDFLSLLQAWRKIMHPDGLLLLSDLGPDTLKEIAAPLLFYKDMHILGDALVASGFTHPVLDVERLTLIYREQAKMQQELQALSMISKTNSPKMSDIPPLTWEVIYAHAWAGPEAEATGVVKIPLSSISRSRV